MALPREAHHCNGMNAEKLSRFHGVHVGLNSLQLAFLPVAQHDFSCSLHD